jgi:cytochrome P450
VIAFAPKESPAFADSMESMGWMRKRLYEEFELRRKQPKDDLIGYLVSSQIDGEHLDDRTLFSLCFNIIIGGVDTTTALTSNALMYLDENPVARRRLSEDRSLIPTACEEFLRYYSPLHGLARNVKTDVIVNRQRLSPGERILLAYASANHDEAIFERPEDIILDRLPNKHIGFGIGIHRCLGSFLARMMFQVMIEEVLDRLPDYKIDRDLAEHYPSICSVNGWAKLPASFTPGTKVTDPSRLSL